MSKHEKFILTPITCVIEEMIAATSGISKGIETYPLWDYILQATFTKMTGSQEQKLKCIDWELASNGYEYRVLFIDDVKNRGTYSQYKFKNKVYNALINEIVRLSEKEGTTILGEIKNNAAINPRLVMQNLLSKTNLICCRQRDYEEFLGCDSEFNNQFLGTAHSKQDGYSLFGATLKERYEKELYRQRNRIAHNTLSYQQNLPDMEMLKNEKLLSRNYFFWFSILYLIDEIFMSLYREYSKCVRENSYFDD